MVPNIERSFDREMYYYSEYPIIENVPRKLVILKPNEWMAEKRIIYCTSEGDLQIFKLSYYNVYSMIIVFVHTTQDNCLQIVKMSKNKYYWL